MSASAGPRDSAAGEAAADTRAEADRGVGAELCSEVLGAAGRLRLSAELRRGLRFPKELCAMVAQFVAARWGFSWANTAPEFHRYLAPAFHSVSPASVGGIRPAGRGEAEERAPALSAASDILCYADAVGTPDPEWVCFLLNRWLRREVPDVYEVRFKLTLSGQADLGTARGTRVVQPLRLEVGCVAPRFVEAGVRSQGAFKYLSQQPESSGFESRPDRHEGLISFPRVCEHPEGIGSWAFPCVLAGDVLTLTVDTGAWTARLSALLCDSDSTEVVCPERHASTSSTRPPTGRERTTPATWPTIRLPPLHGRCCPAIALSANQWDYPLLGRLTLSLLDAP
jgi:hypothetical protein